MPFFAHGVPAALIEGRGEQVAPLPAVIGDAGVLLVTPPEPMSTAAVFARYDALGASGSPPAAGSPTDELAAALGGGLSGTQLAAWAERLREANDLWPAAVSLAPRLLTLRAELEARTGRAWLLSGSGSTLFALYPSLASAVEGGRSLIINRPADLDDALVNAVDLVGPEPAWRFP